MLNAQPALTLADDAVAAVAGGALTLTRPRRNAKALSMACCTCTTVAGKAMGCVVCVGTHGRKPHAIPASLVALPPAARTTFSASMLGPAHAVEAPDTESVRATNDCGIESTPWDGRNDAYGREEMFADARTEDAAA